MYKLLAFLSFIFYIFHFITIYKGFNGNVRNILSFIIYFIFLSISFLNKHYIPFVLMLLAPMFFFVNIEIYKLLRSKYPSDIRTVVKFIGKEESIIIWPILFYSCFVYIFVIFYEILHDIFS